METRFIVPPHWRLSQRFPPRGETVVCFCPCIQVGNSLRHAISASVSEPGLSYHIRNPIDWWFWGRGGVGSNRRGDGGALKGSCSSDVRMTTLGKSIRCTSSRPSKPLRVIISSLGYSSLCSARIRAVDASAIFHLASRPRCFWLA